MQFITRCLTLETSDLCVSELDLREFKKHKFLRMRFDPNRSKATVDQTEWQF